VKNFAVFHGVEKLCDFSTLWKKFSTPWNTSHCQPVLSHIIILKFVLPQVVVPFCSPCRTYADLSVLQTAPPPPELPAGQDFSIRGDVTNRIRTAIRSR
jgi:hypothetical protein